MRKTLAATTIVLAAFGTTAAVAAAAPANAPAGSHGLCNDGSYSTNAEKKGACRGHKGVKEWFDAGSAATATTSSTTTSTTTSMAPAPAAPPVTATTRSTPAAAGTTTTTTKTMAAPPSGGMPGQVWANESTKTYHCSGDKWYGKTKHGAYMSEADAKAKGYHADHGKACTG